MRVLRLCSAYEAAPDSLTASSGFDAIGGMQVHTAALTAELDARGIDQIVVTAFRPSNPRTETVGTSSRVVRVGIPIGHVRQLYGLAAVPEIVRAGPVDVVHAHLGEDLAIAPLARWAAGRSRAPLAVTVHCSPRHTVVPHDLRSGILNTVGAVAESALIRAADAVMVLTDQLARRLERSGVPGSRIRVIPVGIALDVFRKPRPRPEAMDGRRWIVYAGRLVREKGVRDLLDAFAELRVLDTALMLVGDGPDHSELESLAWRLGVSSRVRFTGAVPNEATAAYLQHADVAVLPSWYEERGRVLVEAMAAGTPVVATRTGGIPDTVRNGENGLLVSPRDPRNLAATIHRVLSNERLATSLVAAGRVTAAGHGLDFLTDETVIAYGASLAVAAQRARHRVEAVNFP
jgi:glycogen(starch) synthase